MKNSNSTGSLAEEEVAKYLKKSRCRILARNYTKPWGEIDIVAHKKRRILFIEVKALKSGEEGVFKPEDHFTSEKQEKLVRTCQSYLMENNYSENMEYRIDLAAVELAPDYNDTRLRYYKNAIEYY